jgi:site-specific recombinase XerD
LKAKELNGNQSIKSWLSGIDAKPTTRKSYINSMRGYTEFLGKTPEQLLEEAEDDIKNGLFMRKRRIFNELISFREHLENSGLAPMSIKAKVNAVRSFFEHNYIQLPNLPVSRKGVATLPENWAIPTKEDIRETLLVTDPLEKALILTGTSSGLSINEISNLEIRKFLDGYDKETGITQLNLLREKVGYQFHTFLTPEASKAIWDYLAYRERSPKKKDTAKVNAVLKQRIAKDSTGKETGYLFIRRIIDPEYLITKDEELRKLSTEAILKLYSDLAEKANKASPKGKRNIIRSHNMRKFFNSTLLANGADIFTTDYMLGHKLSGTQDAYFRADPAKLKEKYKQFIPYLTIQKELSVDDSPEFQRLKTENQNFATSLAKATVEKDEIINLRNELEELKKKKEDASGISKEFLLSALKDPAIQELLKNPSN